MKKAIAACVGGGLAAAACTPTTTPAPAQPEPARDASATAADALEELFRDGSPEDIAAELEAMVGATDARPEAGPDAKAAPKPKPKPKPEDMVAPRPVYKGVSFG